MLSRLRLPTQLGASNLRTRYREIASASLILPQLYLSDYSTALDVKELSNLGITHVVSVVNFNGIPDSTQDLSDNARKITLTKLHIALEDTPSSDLLEHLDKTTEWIKQAIEENDTNKVLVHCLQGVSRSPTVVCAYLVATTNMRPSDALKFVQSKRSVVLPNSGFRKQLDDYGLRFAGNGGHKPRDLHRITSLVKRLNKDSLSLGRS